MKDANVVMIFVYILSVFKWIKHTFTGKNFDAELCGFFWFAGVNFLSFSEFLGAKAL